MAIIPLRVLAQTDLAAVMVIDSETVEMQRVGTQQWIPIRLEAVVGVGDTIRTSETGRATITFFQDGVETTLEPSTTYRIDAFSGDNDTFNLSVSVLVGQTQQRIERALDAASSYDVTTPGAELVARGTVFRVRVEEDGRSAMLVTEGNVDAAADGESENIPPLFGVRSEDGGMLSDVIRADTFEQLDAGLDGCAVSVSAPGDVRLNVRLGPSTDFPRVGTVDPADVTNVKGVTPNGDWYRIDFRGGFGWVLAADANVVADCAGLRLFEGNFGPEDAERYESLGDDIQLEDLPGAPTPDATETEVPAPAEGAS